MADCCGGNEHFRADVGRCERFDTVDCRRGCMCGKLSLHNDGAAVPTIDSTLNIHSIPFPSRQYKNGTHNSNGGVMSHEETSQTAVGKFPTTAWSFIQMVQDRRHDEYLPHLNRFASAYWKPVFFFVRAKGYALHRAEDLTQEFFLRLMQREWLEKADPNRGRFRTFLLTVLTRFLSDQGPGRAAKQVVFDNRLVSIQSLLGDADKSYEPPVDETPENIFMRQWAAALVAQVLERLRLYYEENGQPQWYEVFAATHGMTEGSGRVSQEELGQRFGMTRDRVRYAMEMTQKRFVHLIHEEVRDQVGSETEIDNEVRELLALLGS